MNFKDYFSEIVSSKLTDFKGYGEILPQLPRFKKEIELIPYKDPSLEITKSSFRQKNSY